MEWGFCSVGDDDATGKRRGCLGALYSMFSEGRAPRKTKATGALNLGLLE